ncbi:MAG: hypothetical protein ACREV6_09220 [Clostridium sp.]|uniref:hypothetical protein n=1 Tax=Clostridium sp. TaxID=1506 RepID=UPI003D6D207C
MKKVSMKTMLAAVLAASVICTAGVGTYAKYAVRHEAVSTICASYFDISPTGDSFANSKFNVDKLNPMSEVMEFPIVVNKNKTNVDTKYTLSLKTDATKNAIFMDKDKYTSPIKFKLQRKVGEQYITVVEDFKNKPFELNDLNEADTSLKPKSVEEFKLVCSWDSKNDENDTAYQGLTGDFNVAFAAEQVKGAIKPPFVPQEIKANKDISLTWNMHSQVFYRGTDVNPVFNLKNKEIKYYKNEKDLKVFELGDVDYEFNYNYSTKEKVNMKNVIFTEKEAGSKTYVVSSTAGDWKGKEFEIIVKDSISQPSGNRFMNITFTCSNNSELNVHFKATESEINWFNN